MSYAPRGQRPASRPRRGATTHVPSSPLLGLLLRLVHQYWADDIDAALRAAGFDGIRPPHANVFPFVPASGIQVAELARLAHVRKQTMAQAVEQLEAIGYVERRPDPADRRGRLVFLTPRGRAVGPVTLEAGRRVERRWAELTSEDEIASLRASLERLLEGLRAGDRQPDRRTAARSRPQRGPALG